MLIPMMILFVGYPSHLFNQTFYLGQSFLSHIDSDTIDLVSMNDLIVGILFIILYRSWPVVLMKELTRLRMAKLGGILIFLLTTVKVM